MARGVCNAGRFDFDRCVRGSRGVRIELRVWVLDTIARQLVNETPCMGLKQRKNHVSICFSLLAAMEPATTAATTASTKTRANKTPQQKMRP